MTKFNVAGTPAANKNTKGVNPGMNLTANYPYFPNTPEGHADFNTWANKRLMVTGGVFAGFVVVCVIIAFIVFK